MNHWRPQDQQALQNQLRLHGLDESSFARSAAISLAQLRELLHGGEGQFYSASIKAHVGHKLMRRLGLEPERDPEPPAPTPADMPLNAAATLAPAAASPVSIAAGPSSGFRPGKGLLTSWGQPWSLLVMGSVAVVAVLMLRQQHDSGLDLQVLGDRGDQPASHTAMRVTPPAAQTTAVTFPAEAAVNSTAPIKSQALALETKVSAATTECGWSQEKDSTRFQTDGPTKPGNYVHFVADHAVTVCVVDQSRKMTQLQLGDGEARSVYGEGPFLVHVPPEASVKMFFQGRRVPSLPSSGYLVLQPTPLG